MAAVDGDILAKVSLMWFPNGTALSKRRKRNTITKVINRTKINRISMCERMITPISLLSTRITNENTFERTG